MADELFLVAGLGNPGAEYAGTRHNVGFMVVDLLAARTGITLSSHRSKARVGPTRLGDARVVLVEPMSFMNLSGGPVRAVQTFFKVTVDHVVVVHDEIDLPFGTLRVKQGGGDNGHNGLRSVTANLGPNYLRVRVGVGRPHGRMDPADYVLRPFAAVERAELPLVVERAADAVESLVSDGLVATQQTVNAHP